MKPVIHYIERREIDQDRLSRDIKQFIIDAGLTQKAVAAECHLINEIDLCRLMLPRAENGRRWMDWTPEMVTEVLGAVKLLRSKP